MKCVKINSSTGQFFSFLHTFGKNAQFRKGFYQKFRIFNAIFFYFKTMNSFRPTSKAARDNHN